MTSFLPKYIYDCIPVLLLPLVPVPDYEGTQGRLGRVRVFGQDMTDVSSTTPNDALSLRY